MLHRYKKSFNFDAFLGQTDHMDSFFESEQQSSNYSPEESDTKTLI